MKFKKNIFQWVILLTVLLAILITPNNLLAASAGKPRLYIKVKGIAGWGNGGHFQTYYDDNTLYFNSLMESNSDYQITQSKPGNYLGYGGEIGLETRHYAVGIAVEYFKKDFQIDYNYEDSASSFRNQYIKDHSFIAVPLFLFIHYKVVNTRFLKAFVTIGEGVYLTQYQEEMNQTFTGASLTYAYSKMECERNALGFHLGATIDFSITSNLALFIEGGYRYVSFKDIPGKYYYENNITSYIQEGNMFYGKNAEGWPRYHITQPAEGSGWETIPAEFNLNGFHLHVVIKLIFGSPWKPTNEANRSQVSYIERTRCRKDINNWSLWIIGPCVGEPVPGWRVRCPGSILSISTH